MRHLSASEKTSLDFLSGGGEMGEIIRSHDWSGHPLGTPDTWPQSLKTSVSLILSSQHPMWIGWGAEMSFLYNDAYLHVLGIAKHPWALGRPASEVWAEIWDVCGPLADKVFREAAASFVDDVRLFMNRGDFIEEVYYSFSYSPIRDEQGKVEGLFCPSNDVTPKVLNARRLRTLSELAGNSLDQHSAKEACAAAARTLGKNPDDVPFGLLYLADSSGAHASLEETVRLPHEGGLKAPRSVDLRAEGAPDSVWPFAEVFTSKQSQCISVRHFEALPYGPADQPVAEAIILPVVPRIHEKPVGLLICGLNPTRRFDAEYQTFLELAASHIGAAIQNARVVEEEKRRADMLAEIDRAKTAFFSNVSHEFRTPLTLMLGPLENLLRQNEALAPDQRAEIEKAHRNSLRLLKLVNSLLDFSRIEAGRMRASFTPVDLARLTTDLAANFRSAMEAAGLTLDVECDPLRQSVYVDRDMWEKVVLNLLSNAFKFTFEGAVTVRLTADGDDAVLTVADTGTGIPDSELPKVFERFHRVEGAKGRTYEGSGIGLALIKELVKLHSGTVEVASRTGEGSTFTVKIPFGTAHLPSDQIRIAEPQANGAGPEAYTHEALTWIARDRLLHPTEENAETQTQKGPRARILLAEDNADMREHVAHIIGDKYELITAPDGQAALEKAKRERPDLILSDVMMPRLDGFEFLSALRSDPQMVHVPFIMLSARAGEESRSEGMGAGADDYLVKPFSARELLTRVAAHLKLAQARQEANNRERVAHEEAEALNRVAHALGYETDLQKLVQIVTDVATKLTNAQFGAFFYNVLNQQGESYMLYTLSGASREEFEKLGMMPRNTPVFHTTFSGAGTRRSDDIRQDPDYGTMAPHFGMPKGHLPVRSYLAVPVKARSGEVLGGLFFGHPDPNVFTASAERLAEGIAAHAALAIDNAHLFQRAEEQARAAKLLASIVDTSDDAIISKNLDGVITSWNKGAERLFGYTATEAMGQTVANLLIPASRRDEEPDILDRLQRGEHFDHFETVRQRKDGKLLDISLTLSPLRDANGNIVGASKIARDITERKKMENELRSANQDLEQFAYSASHDLQEPLRSVKIFSELLSDRYTKQLDAQALQFLGNVRASATRMEQLVRDLLSYTQTTTAEKATELVDANAALQAALSSLAGAIAESNAAVTHAPLPHVRVHTVQLAQVFQNLIGNAIKYCRPGIAPLVHISAEKGDGTWVFSVSDNGIGIEPEYEEKIFGLFKRLHTSDEYSGTGIGLALCQRIVERHNGRIWVESEPEKGSTFYFSLPQ